jgi:hypothetical protein
MGGMSEQQNLVMQLRERFPDDAYKTDQWLLERGFDQDDLLEVTYAWMEAFADRTTDAIKRRDTQVIKLHTDFISFCYLAGTDTIKELIDVGYSENLMWDIGTEEKVWA